MLAPTTHEIKMWKTAEAASQSTRANNRKNGMTTTTSMRATTQPRLDWLTLIRRVWRVYPIDEARHGLFGALSKVERGCMDINTPVTFEIISTEFLKVRDIKAR
jgi:hypothetical protein